MARSGKASGGARTAAVLAAAAAALLLLLLTTTTAPASAAKAHLMVPAYFDPTGNGATLWTQLTQTAQAGKVNVTAIMNPDNGPGKKSQSDYVSAMKKFRAAGGVLLGYVPTATGNKSPSWVVQRSANYVSWYDVDGIFLDELSTSNKKVSTYEQYASGIRALKSGIAIVGNPGTTIPASYLAVADTLMTFESSAAQFTGHGWQAPSWGASQPASRQACIAYSASESAVSTLVADAVSRRYGYVFFTSSGLPNPYANLGSSGFFAALVGALE